MREVFFLTQEVLLLNPREESRVPSVRKCSIKCQRLMGVNSISLVDPEGGRVCQQKTLFSVNKTVR